MGETKKQRSPLTTLCYIEKDDSYLMLHRIKKKQDVNEGKWIGVGGHFEENESPENCLLREVKEETGLTLTSWRFRGIVTFIAKGWPTEYMCLYTADGFEGTLRECDEGELAWVAKKDDKYGNNLYKGEGGFNSNNYSIKQKYLEGSNVDSTNEIDMMMETVNEFEANQKVIQTIDSILGQIASDIGRVK